MFSPGHGDPHSPPTDILAVSSSAGLVGVLLPLEHHEGEAGNTLGHPDLLDGAEPLEDFLQVPLAGSTVQVGHVQPLTLQLLLRGGPRPRPSPPARARPPPGTARPSPVARPVRLSATAPARVGASASPPVSPGAATAGPRTASSRSGLGSGVRGARPGPGPGPPTPIFSSLTKLRGAGARSGRTRRIHRRTGGLVSGGGFTSV